MLLLMSYECNKKMSIWVDLLRAFKQFFFLFSVLLVNLYCSWVTDIQIQYEHAARSFHKLDRFTLTVFQFLSALVQIELERFSVSLQGNIR